MINENDAILDAIRAAKEADPGDRPEKIQIKHADGVVTFMPGTEGIRDVHIHLTPTHEVDIEALEDVTRVRIRVAYLKIDE